ncbi:hypothetical protein [Algoriphagus boritolerans]|uniref:hypothetical protein n=1 Tax=Algoriphagus boritolerans TaxID=308111 RepID=UPI000A92F1A8
MKKSLFVVLALAFFQFGCNKPAENQAESTEFITEPHETTQTLPTGDNSQTSLDWNGTYFNTLPVRVVKASRLGSH